MKISIGKILLFGALIGGAIFGAKKLFGGTAYVPLDYKFGILGDGIKYKSAGLNKVADKIKDFTGWTKYGMSENTGKSLDTSFADCPLYASMVNGKLYLAMPKSYVDTMIEEEQTAKAKTYKV